MKWRQAGNYCEETVGITVEILQEEAQAVTTFSGLTVSADKVRETKTQLIG